MKAVQPYIVTRFARTGKDTALFAMAANPVFRKRVLRTARLALRDAEPNFRKAQPDDDRTRLFTRLAALYLERKRSYKLVYTQDEQNIASQLAELDWPSSRFYRYRGDILHTTKVPWAMAFQELDDDQRTMDECAVCDTPPLTPDEPQVTCSQAVPARELTDRSSPQQAHPVIAPEEPVLLSFHQVQAALEGPLSVDSQEDGELVLESEPLLPPPAAPSPEPAAPAPSPSAGTYSRL